MLETICATSLNCLLPLIMRCCAYVVRKRVWPVLLPIYRYASVVWYYTMWPLIFCLLCLLHIIFFCYACVEVTKRLNHLDQVHIYGYSKNFCRIQFRGPSVQLNSSCFVLCMLLRETTLHLLQQVPTIEMRLGILLRYVQTDSWQLQPRTLYTFSVVRSHCPSDLLRALELPTVVWQQHNTLSKIVHSFIRRTSNDACMQKYMSIVNA